MFYNAKNERLMIGDTDMDYISFGKGKKNLILIPGLGDGLTTVRGLAIPYALTHPEFAKEYKVYVFSRKNRLKQGYTTKDMARDVFVAMSKFGIKKADYRAVMKNTAEKMYVETKKFAKTVLDFFRGKEQVYGII